MKELTKTILGLQQERVGELVRTRMNDFAQMHAKGNRDWFLELCFCILTANTSAQMGLKMQNALSYEDFAVIPQKQLVKKLNKLRCRFYKRRAEFITLAREHANIKDKVKSFQNEFEARKWLAQNIKGIGYKESSHFLRNTGHQNLAILDKHVLNLLGEHKIIERPKNMSAAKYFEIESKLAELCKKTNTTQAELDLYLWYLKTGKVLK